jgi:hypothetical protein
MSSDEQAVRELLQRVAPDLGQLSPPAAMRRAARPHRARLVAVVGAVTAVVTLAVVIALNQPDSPGKTAAPAASRAPGQVEGTSALRQLVSRTPCPPPKHTPLATRAELAGFPAVAAVTCSYAERTYPHDGQWSVLIKKASATGVEQLKDAFERPDVAAPRKGVACASVLIVGAPVLFVNAAGDYLVPRYPIDHTCEHPLPFTMQAVDHQPWKAISTTRLQQDRTPAELAAGCADRIKNVVGLDVRFGIDPSPGGPVFTYHPHASLTACIYHVSAHDAEVGDFVRGVHLTAAESAQLRQALTGPGPTSQTCPTQDTFAAISTRGGDTVYLELGGCWRLERDEAHVTVGTANPATVSRLLDI